MSYDTSFSGQVDIVPSLPKKLDGGDLVEWMGNGSRRPESFSSVGLDADKAIQVLGEADTCPECGGEPDDRVRAGMKCARCAYGPAERWEDHD